MLLDILRRHQPLIAKTKENPLKKLTISTFFSNSSQTCPSKNRAEDDRNLTLGFEKYFGTQLKKINLSNMIVFDFGAGKGNLYLELMKMDPVKRPAVVIQFELERYLSQMNPDVLLNEAKENCFNYTIDKNDCLLRINPREFFVDIFEKGHKNVGNFQFYNIYKMLNALAKIKIQKFIIIGNPPYYLWNRILSLTDHSQCQGVLGITSMRRVYNHTGGIVVAIIPAIDFNPSPKAPQALVWQGKITQQLQETKAFFKFDSKKSVWLCGSIPDTVEHPFYPLGWIAGMDTVFWNTLKLDFYAEFHQDSEVELFLTYIMMDHYQHEVPKIGFQHNFYEHAKDSVKKMLDGINYITFFEKLRGVHVSEEIIKEYLDNLNFHPLQKKL